MYKFSTKLKPNFLKNLIITFELKIGWLSMKKYNLNVNIFSVFVEEILKKVTHTLISNVSTNHNMPEV